jgi:CTP:molybdopterin cytidylyltransferase MocA
MQHPEPSQVTMSESLSGDRSDMVATHGLLLAAGAGRRYGGPKALVDGRLWHALDVLAEGGCSDRTVVLGAEADRIRTLVPADVAVVVAETGVTGWARRCVLACGR